MKPYQFSYVAARDQAQVVDLLRTHGGEAKILAGGQSLMPMMNFRLLRPALLVDINRVADLSGIRSEANGVRIGALTRHCETETSALIAHHFPVLSAAMSHVAHLTVRNRGTFGGSLSHADPAAELPMMALLLDATIIAASVDGTRRIAAQDFFVSALTTSLAPDELLTEIELPFLPAGTGWGFEEFARRHGDYALAAVGVTMRIADGLMRDVRIAMMGVGDTPLRATSAERVLDGRPCTDGTWRDAVQAVRDSVQPNSDLNASAEYRRHLVGVLARRALMAASHRAEGTAS